MRVWAGSIRDRQFSSHAIRRIGPFGEMFQLFFSWFIQRFHLAYFRDSSRNSSIDFSTKPPRNSSIDVSRYIFFRIFLKQLLLEILENSNASSFCNFHKDYCENFTRVNLRVYSRYVLINSSTDFLNCYYRRFSVVEQFQGFWINLCRDFPERSTRIPKPISQVSLHAFSNPDLFLGTNGSRPPRNCFQEFINKFKKGFLMKHTR